MEAFFRWILSYRREIFLLLSINRPKYTPFLFSPSLPRLSLLPPNDNGIFPSLSIAIKPFPLCPPTFDILTPSVHQPLLYFSSSIDYYLPITTPFLPCSPPLFVRPSFSFFDNSSTHCSSSYFFRPLTLSRAATLFNNNCRVVRYSCNISWRIWSSLVTISAKYFHSNDIAPDNCVSCRQTMAFFARRRLDG